MARLRAKVFLISWPLGVLSLALLTLTIDRESTVELRRIERTLPPDVRGPELVPLERALAIALSRGDTSAVRRQLSMHVQSTDATQAFAVLDDRGRLIASTDSAVRTVTETGALGALRLWRRRVLGPDGRLAVAEIQIAGRPLRVADAPRAVGELVLFPQDAPDLEPRDAGVGAGAWIASLRRTAWRTALIVGISSALIALLLATPFVRRVRRLSDAAHAIGAGHLSARLPVRGNDELDELAAAFNTMGAALEASRLQQQRMIADIAHELRTPLTNIVGLTEALQDGLKAPDAATLASLRDEGALLERLVTDLQDLQLAESGRLALHVAPVDADAVVRRVAAAMQPTSPSVTILVGEPAQSSAAVSADPVRLEQVLRNLVQNAVTASATTGHVTLRVVADADTVTFTVQDTGEGIAADDLARVWERFFRIDTARSRERGGMGLGLALVKQLTEAMDGSVSVDSTPGAGTTFRVTLPRATARGE